MTMKETDAYIASIEDPRLKSRYIFKIALLIFQEEVNCIKKIPNNDSGIKEWIRVHWRTTKAAIRIRSLVNAANKVGLFESNEEAYQVRQFIVNTCHGTACSLDFFPPSNIQVPTDLIGD